MKRKVTAEELQRVGAARVSHRLARRDAFVKLATMLYGDRWQLPLSQPLDISQASLSYMSAAKRDISDELFEKLVAHSKEVARHMQVRVDTVRAEIASLPDRLAAIGPKPELVGSDPDPEPDMSP